MNALHTLARSLRKPLGGLAALMFLALTLGALAAPAARAEPGGGGGYWLPMVWNGQEYVVPDGASGESSLINLTGTVHVTGGFDGDYTSDVTDGTGADATAEVGARAEYSTDLLRYRLHDAPTGQVSLKARYLWMGDAASRPKSVSILISYHVDGWVGGVDESSGSVSVSGGGLSTSAILPQTLAPHQERKRLVQVAVGDDGIAEVSLTGQISLSVTVPQGSAGSYLSAEAGGSIGGNAVIDERAVTIGCPAVDVDANGGSKYREPALTGPIITNQREADGTLRGDTALYRGSGGAFFGFIGNVAGSWSTGSDYHWYSSLSGYSYSGVWPNMTTFSAPEYVANIGRDDHIFLSLYDAGPDKAEASANYHLHLHDRYEPSGWPEDSSSPAKVMGSDPEAPGWPTYPWTLATDQDGGIIPPLIGPQGSNTGFNFQGEKTQGGNVDGALGVGKGDVNIQFGGGYDWSKTTVQGIIVNPTPDIPAGYQTWAIKRLSVNRHKGHLDIYGQHGYEQTGVWRRDEIVTTDYSYYQPYQPTNLTPFEPAPGWNPPGY